jgi:Tfp pilus assembly protein PilN
MVVGLLVVALALVTIYVLTSNSISQRREELSSLRQQLTQTQAASGALTRYSQFTQLAQTRTQTVQEIAASRFDWAKAMSELADVIPADATLESLTATVNPGASAGGTSSGGSGLRSDISVPAFELVGCTATQDDVARLMSRLRLINGVTRVTLSDSVKDAAAAAASTLTPSGATPGASCGASAPTFDIVVFFQQPGAAPATTTPAAASTPGTTPTASTTPATGAATTAAPLAATPASTSTGGTQ